MFIRLSLLHPFQYRSVSYEPKLRSESVTTNQQFYPDHHLYTQQSDISYKYFSLNSSPTQSHENLLQKQSAKTLFKSSSNRSQQNETEKKAHEVKLSYQLEQQKREVQLLQAANLKLKSQLDFKQKELHVYRAKYQDLFKSHQQKNNNDEVIRLKQELIDLQEKYKDLEKEHISEIALLKSNLNNSIFQEEEEEHFCEIKNNDKKIEQQENVLSFAMALNDQKNNPFQDDTVIQKYNQIAVPNALSEIQLQIQLLKEENSIYKEQILRLVGENEQSYQDIEKQLKEGYSRLEDILHQSITSRVIQLENENQNLKAALTIQQIDKVKEIKEKLDELDVLDEETINDHNDVIIIKKIFRLIQWAKELELEVEDWKRNYWQLEKKLHVLELKDESSPMFHKKNKKSEIEIEFDFTNNQIIRTKVKSSEKKLEEHIKENLKLKHTIKELQEKLNDSKLKPQSHKNLLQKLISQQCKKQQFPTPKQVAERSQVGMDKVFAKKNCCPVKTVACGNNHNLPLQQSQQSSTQTQQTRTSPLQRIPAMNLNLTSLSPIACKQYYAMAGIGVKQSSQSPIHYK